MKLKNSVYDVESLQVELINMGIKPNLGLNDIVQVLMVDEDSIDIIRRMIVEVEHVTSSLTFAREFRKRAILQKVIVREKKLREEMMYADTNEKIRRSMINFFCCNVEQHEIEMFKDRYSQLLSSVKLGSLRYEDGRIDVDEEVMLRPKMIIDICM